MEGHLDSPAPKKQRAESQDEDSIEYPFLNLYTLPWQRSFQASYDPSSIGYANLPQCDDINPGEFVLRALFTEFTVLAERKIERLLKEPLERPLSKSLQRGEDPQFDQLLSSLSSVAEHCLPSLLRTLFQWYERQTGKEAEDLTRSRSPTRAWGGSESPRPVSRAGIKDREALWERRNLAVEFIFCLVLIEVLRQLSVHPVEESQIQFIENHAFMHFKNQDSGSGTTQSQVNRSIVTALYAEVIGVLAMTRFQSVRRRFMQEYKENQSNSRALVNIIMGLKFIRIKLFPVDELEESFIFLQECATLFLEKNLDKEVRYAFASLFVELLIPVAATAKREYGIPAVKKFVDMLYKDALDLARKAKHSSTMYPLVTALLCISQKQFFLTNWSTFLTMCLSHIKSRDTKLQRMAMECLYRLLWVYVIRVKCENHASTLTRLRSITETLFPKNSRTVVPRNIPLAIFVKIIQFIAQEKLDFAMQDIIFDLLNVGRSNRQLNPERMNIGLRAFLVIADKLQRKEGAPPMPSTIGVLPSGNTLKVKKSFTKLTEQAARSIGVVTYYTNVRRALDQILRTLDIQVGRTMTMNNPQCLNKEPIDMITGERKPKIDLFRTCVAAIPKCVPEGMSKSELVDLVSRLTLHLDEELKGLAYTALQSLIMDFPEYREDVILGYINFTLKEVPDTYPDILESCIRGALQLIIQWKTAISQPLQETKSDRYLEMSMRTSDSPEMGQSSEESSIHVVHYVEGFALVMLCSTKPMHRKLALMVLREARCLARAMTQAKPPDEVTCIDIIEEHAPVVIEKALSYVSGSDKSSLGLSPTMDLQLLAEKSALLADKDSKVAGISRDAWAHCFSGFLDRIYGNQNHCSCTFQYSWPHVYNRLLNMYAILDPNVDFDSISSRASISVKAPKKAANLSSIWLWRNYLIFACCTPPKSALSKSPSSYSSQELLQAESGVKGELQMMQDVHSLSDIFKSTVLLIKSESPEIREATVTGLGKTVAAAHVQLIEEMHVLIREVLDRKAEGVRKKKKRDLLRLQVARVFAANAEQGCFKCSLFKEGERTTLVASVTEYIEGMRYVLDSETDREDPNLIQLRLFFSKFLHKMIKSIPSSMQVNLLDNRLRHNLFLLLAGWCGHFNVSTCGTSTNSTVQSAELEFSALEAMCALVCCGEVFDQKALEVSNGYLYKLLDTMLGSENAKVHSLGRESVELLLENNEKIPALLNWVIDRCYTGSKGVSSGCFLALANVFYNKLYPCRLVPLLCVVLFKTGDGSAEVRERAAQLLHLLDRRFFAYTTPFRTAFAGYSYNQQNFSRELASTHPELTLPMLAEITLRFETTSMVGQRCLLQYQLPWLENIELVDVSLPQITTEGINSITDELFENNRMTKAVDMGGDGWGSNEATQMVLTNLFYITAKYDEYFSKEIEAAWASLCRKREANVHLILEYLIVMSGLCGTPALPHIYKNIFGENLSLAFPVIRSPSCLLLITRTLLKNYSSQLSAKKVATYVARANTKKTVDELMDALRLTETVSTSWERLDNPPYYRYVGKSNQTLNNTVSLGGRTITPVKESISEKEVEPARVLTSERQGSEDRSGSCGSAKAFAESVLEVAKQNKIAAQSEHKRQESGTDELWPLQWLALAQANKPKGTPLPMPEESRYFAPITCIFPPTMPPAHLYRCNFGVMLLTEIVADSPEVQWIINLPLMLHVSFLGLDHMKPLVHEHCKRLLINLVVVLVCRGERSTVAKALLDFQSVSNIALDRSISVKGSINAIVEEGSIVDNADPGISDPENVHRNSPSLSQASDRDRINSAEDNSLSVEDKARELIEFLTKSDCRPLWPFEDITPRNTAIKSAEQLEAFLRMVMSIFEEAVPHAHLLERWSYEALHWATSCSSRHYAGRSFQVFRGIRTPLTWTMLSDVLQRFTESVSEQSDDMQGYAMEILLTFLSAVQCAFAESPRPFLEDYLGHDIDNQSMDDLLYRLPGCHVADIGSTMAGHSRSYSTDFELGYPLRQRSVSEGEALKQHKRYASELTLPRSIVHYGTNVPSLKELTDFQQLPENPLDMLARLFWIGVSLLESDFEHEFIMAVNLIQEVLHGMDLTKSESLERVEKIFPKLHWPGFPGVQSLLLKGLTSSATADATLKLLAELTTMVNISIIDPSPASGLSLNILALLPTLVNHFDDVDERSATIATNIAKACEIDKSLSNLGKVMILYKEKDYSKSVQTWIEVVCKYILDVFPHLSTTMLALLVEILEQGPYNFQQPVLNTICAILKYSDASSPGLKQFHGHLLKVVTGHVKDVNLWRDSLNILKLVVSNSSQIHNDALYEDEGQSVRSSVYVPTRASIASILPSAPRLPWGSSLTIAESSWSGTASGFRKELPGRTLQFTYDVTTTPLIGAKFERGSRETINDGKTDESSSNFVSCWRRPHGSQKKTREHLIQLLPLCGHKGALKASHSVTFSSSSDLAVESKQAASSGEASGDEQADIDETGFSGRQLRNVFTEFDFLDDELDKESDDMNSFGWASTTELRKGESMENLRSMPSASRSGSEEELREHKDEELSDEEESEYGTSLTSSVLESMKESMVDDDDDESDHEESQTTIAIDVKADQIVIEKPEPSPASLYSNDSTLDGIEEQDSDNVNDVVQTDQNDLPNERLEPICTSPVQTLTLITLKDIPSKWSSFVTGFLSSPSMLSAVESLPYFPLVLKASCCWLQSLTKDCCEYFNPHLKVIYDKYTVVRQTIDEHLHIPYIFIDKQTFDRAGLLARHKFTTLKLNESIQVLQEKREQTVEQLQSLQKQKDLANETDVACDCQFFAQTDVEPLPNDGRIVARQLLSLCFSLHRLHVQLIMCLEIYQSYLNKIIKSTQQLEISDLSEELAKGLAKIDLELERDLENITQCNAKNDSDGFEGKIEEESPGLEKDRDSYQGSDLQSESDCMVQELTDGAMPEVGQSPSEEEPKEYNSFFREELGVVESILQCDSNDVSSDHEETTEPIHPDISNEDIKTAHIVNSRENVALETISQDWKCDNGNSYDQPANELVIPKEPCEVQEDLNPSKLMADYQTNEIGPDGGDGDATWSESPERNVSVSELRLNSSPYICDNPPAIETILENVIISSSFREDNNSKIAKNNKKSNRNQLTGQKSSLESRSGNSSPQLQKRELEKTTGSQDEAYRVDDEKKVEETDDAKAQDAHELEEKHAQLEAVEYEDSVSCSDNVNESHNGDKPLTNLPGKEIAEEEQQHEVRISDSYGLIEIALSLMTDDKDCWTENERGAGAGGEVQLAEKLIAEIGNFIEEGEFSEAIQFLRKCRGCHDAADTFLNDNERDIIMVLFAKCLLKNKASVFALTNSLESLAEVCDQLSECMTELLAIICAENRKQNK